MRLLFIIFFIFSGSSLVHSEVSGTKLMGLDGKSHSLSDYIGKDKWVILNVWGTACPYCRAELDALIDFHEAHEANDAMVIGVTVHWPSFGYPDEEDLYYFSLDYFISYPLLMADAKLASELIGQPVNMIPLTFFYNPEGKLVKRLNGVVTINDLEGVINQDPENYETQWTKEVPPEFRPE